MGWKYPKRQNRSSVGKQKKEILRKGAPFPVLAEKLYLWKGRKRSGTETNDQGWSLAGENPWYQKLPTHKTAIKMTELTFPDGYEQEQEERREKLL